MVDNQQVRLEICQPAVAGYYSRPFQPSCIIPKHYCSCPFYAPCIKPTIYTISASKYKINRFSIEIDKKSSAYICYNKIMPKNREEQYL